LPTEAEDINAHLIGELDRLNGVAQPLGRADPRAADRVSADVTESVESEFDCPAAACNVTDRAAQQGDKPRIRDSPFQAPAGFMPGRRRVGRIRARPSARGSG